MNSMKFFHCLLKNKLINSCNWQQFVFSLFFLTCAVFLASCGENQRTPEPKEGVLIYAALNPVSSEIKNSINIFNQNHTEVQIEIHDYSDEGGLERLQTELVLGQVPDIMEMHYFGSTFNRRTEVKNGQRTSWRSTQNNSLERPADEYWMPYRQMAQKGYLEDLWPYIENDPELGRDGVLQAPMKAAEVNGGLYILFMEVRINTVMGPESIVGDRYSWTLEELFETFSAMQEGSTILRYNATKRDLFFDLLCSSISKYVNIDTGTCSFDSQDFRELLALLEYFPNESDFTGPEKASEEIMERIRAGKQMLEVTQISWPEDLIRRDGYWQERTAFPGYPTADGSSGNSFYPMGDILAMSATCQDKDAAWEYIRELIKPRRNKETAIVSFVSTPVNMNDYDWFLWGNLVYLTKNCKEINPDDPTLAVLPWLPFGAYGPEIYPMELLTEEDMKRFETLLNSTTLLYWPDDELSNIVWDSIGPYLAGDRSLDDTVALVQNRAQLYVNEMR